MLTTVARVVEGIYTELTSGVPEGTAPVGMPTGHSSSRSPLGSSPTLSPWLQMRMGSLQVTRGAVGLELSKAFFVMSMR